LPPRAQLPTCFHTRLRRTLGPSPCRLSPVHLSHMPPTDFYSGVFPEHTCDLPKPCRSLQRRTAARQAVTPLAGLLRPSFFRLGVSLAFQPFRPPPRRPLAAVDLPQPDQPGHLLSRTRVELRLKVQRTPTTVRLRPLSNGYAQQASPKLNLPCRAASCMLSRKNTPSAAPEVPSSTLAPRLREAAASAKRRIARPQPSDAFLTNINTRLDEAGISLARPPGT
jgi:hypothetical protein